MTSSYFFDTYAFVEIGKGNPDYQKYSGIKFLTTKLNLMELALFLRREKREHEIKELFTEFSRFAIDYDDDTLLEAAKMKFDHKGKFLSYIDCIGYILAKKHNARFLTGDEKFRHLDNVEFVK